MVRAFKIILFLGLIIVAANYKTLGFYFWHDDFSSLYGSQVHHCIHGWPYYSFCTIFPPLVKIFGYRPFPYFLIGNILEFFSVILFYFFLVKIIKNSKVSLLLSGILASSYVSAGIFLEAWDPLISYSVLSTLFLSMIVYFEALKYGLNKKLFVVSTVIFLISISLFNFRAVTNFAPIIALIVIYAKKTNIRRRFILSLLVATLFFFVFYITPVKIQNLPKMPLQFDPSLFSLYKIKYLFQTVSSFIVPDFIQSSSNIKTLVGFAVSIAFIIYTFIKKHDKNLTKLRIFSVIWILTMFAPYWIRDDFSLNTTHRYILWIYPGMLLAWASLSKFKLWVPISIILILVNIVAVNSYYSDFLTRSRLREKFYADLHALLPKVSEGSILYFDFQPNIRPNADDYFRVGLTPPESAIGTEYAVNYKKITLVTRSQDLERLLVKPNFPTMSFYSFYYDNKGKLVDTTSVSRSMIKELQSNNQNRLNFQNYTPLVPVKLKIQIISRQSQLTLPYKVTCDKCETLNADEQELQRIFSFLSLQSDIASIKTSDNGEKSDALYISDNSISTYWIGDRQLWYNGNRPFIDFTLPVKTDTDGIALYSTSLNHIPTEFSIEADGNRIDSLAEKWINGQKIIFNKGVKGGVHLKITFLKTDGGDVPIINDLKLIPKGYKDIDLPTSDKIRDSLASYTVTKNDYMAFTGFLSSGITACMEYKSQSYGNGQIGFKLFADGKAHDYEIEIPSLGIENPEFKISCLPYPIKLSIGKTSLGL